MDLVRKIDNNWWEVRHGNKAGIVPVAYLDVLREPQQGMLIIYSIFSRNNESTCRTRLEFYVNVKLKQLSHIGKKLVKVVQNSGTAFIYPAATINVMIVIFKSFFAYQCF